MENEFKKKLMEKYAEDERLEQYNAMRRRQKEIDLKKEVNKYLIVFKLRLKNNGKKNLDNIIYKRPKKLMNWRIAKRRKFIKEKLFKRKKKDLLLNMRNC